MKTFTSTDTLGHDLVHMVGSKDDYVVTENSGTITYTSNSWQRTYIVSGNEQLSFKRPDSQGKTNFKWDEEFAPFAVPDWTKIIDGVGTTLTDLSNFGDTTQIASTFYSDPTYGVGWGTNDDARKSFIIDSGISFTEMFIEFSGVYDTPNQSLGYLEVSDYDAVGINWNNRDSAGMASRDFIFTDGNSNPSSGQYLTINGVNLMSGDQIDVWNRQETFTTSKKVISMAGYTSSYPYGKRYIKNLWVR